MFVLFFFKQKTAYEMRISDWSSDVCSSDLGTEPAFDVVLVVNGLWLDEQRLQRRLARQEGLRQRRAAIRDIRLVTNQPASALVGLLPENRGQIAAGLSCADDPHVGFRRSVRHGTCQFGLWPVSRGTGVSVHGCTAVRRQRRRRATHCLASGPRRYSRQR